MSDLNSFYNLKHNGSKSAPSLSSVDAVLIVSVDDEDSFTTVGKRGKPLRPKVTKSVVAIEVGQPDKEDMDGTHHPDFCRPKGPFDVLFSTQDGKLFWYSLPLLACYSPYFAAIDWDTLRRPDRMTVRSECMNLATTSSSGFALILHAISLDYTQRRIDATLEKSHKLPFPYQMLGDDLLDSLHQALAISDSLRIASFVQIIREDLLLHTQAIMSHRPFDAFALALVGESVELMRMATKHFPANVRGSIPFPAARLIKDLGSGVPRDLWSAFKIQDADVAQ